MCILSTSISYWLDRHTHDTTEFLNDVQVQGRYLGQRESILRTANDDPAMDFATQMSKLAHGVLTGAYVAPPSSAGPDAAEGDFPHLPLSTPPFTAFLPPLLPPLLAPLLAPSSPAFGPPLNAN